MLDAAFATAHLENFAFIIDEVQLFIDETKDGKNPPPLDMLQSNVLEEIEQVWQTDVLQWIHDHHKDFEDYLHSLLGTLIAAITIDPWKDLKAELIQWHKTGVFSRALIATRNSIALRDLLGTERYDLNYWIKTAATPEV
jgi:hypothetical protein